MKPTRIHVEGASIGDALQKAAAELGVSIDQVAYELDREHFAAGADTVRLFAFEKPKGEFDPAARIRELWQNLAKPGAVRVDVRPDRVRVDLTSEVEADGPELQALLAGQDWLAGKVIEVTVRSGERPARREGGRDRSEGPRDRSRRGPPREGREFRERREPRADGAGPRPRPDPVRDARIEEEAHAAVRSIEAGESSVQIAELNSYERRLVHQVVALHPGFVSKSLGEGLRKTVVIERGTDDSAH